MMPIQSYLAAAHLDDLLRDAAAARLARMASDRERDAFGRLPARPPRRRDVRRSLARAALQLSHAAGGAARRLDPCLEEALAAATRGSSVAGPATGSAGR